MADAVTISISGIKCDNPDCDYIDALVNKDNYLEYVNKPCPKCDSILLTQEDYDTVLLLEAEAIDINADFAGIILGDEETRFAVEIDGTGSIVMTEKEG